MILSRRRFAHLSAGTVGATAVLRFAWAQAYPVRPVHIIVGFGPGGAPDILARLIGHWLSERLGQQFIVENRPGAGGNIGTETVVRAAADRRPRGHRSRHRRPPPRSGHLGALPPTALHV